MLEAMEYLAGKFWTSEDEMLAEINECGCDVVYVDYEQVVVADEDDEEVAFKLVRAGSTIAIQM